MTGRQPPNALHSPPSRSLHAQKANSQAGMTDFETVEQLLLNYRDALEATLKNGNRADKRSSVALEMSDWWKEGSFPELERYLAHMRRYRLDVTYGGYQIIQLRQHIDWWYIDAGRKAVENTRTEKCRGGGCTHCRNGKTVTNGHHTWGTGTYTFTLIRDQRADQHRAETGVHYLLTRFQAEHITPRLPVDLWRIVTGQPERAA